VKLSTINGAYRGLGTKINTGRRFYRESMTRREVLSFAENAAGPGDRLSQARRLFATLKAVVRYYGDTVGVERIKAPWEMIEEIRDRGFTGGDCDDQAVLAYTLLNLLGIPAVFRVAWYGQENPRHIYVMAQISGKWTPFDTTKADVGYERAYVRIKDIA
jgi:transglutaminase-like putative cysteine protease